MSRKPNPPLAPHVARAVQAALSRPGAAQPSAPTQNRLAPHVAAAIQAAGGRPPATVQQKPALPMRPAAPVIQRASMDVDMDLSGDGGGEEERRSTRRKVPSTARDDFRRLLHAKLNTFLHGGGDNPGLLDAVAAAFDPPDSNGMVSRNCSAVCTINGQSYIAWNSPKPGLLNQQNESDATRLAWRGHLQAVGGADATKHAEMKILDATTITVNGGYIGLSKAGGCCPLCASVMALIPGVTTRGRHTNKPTNWKMPEWLKNSIPIFNYLGAEMVQSLSVLYPGWLTITTAPGHTPTSVIFTFHQGGDWGRAILEIEDAIRRWL